MDGCSPPQLHNQNEKEKKKTGRNLPAYKKII